MLDELMTPTMQFLKTTNDDVSTLAKPHNHPSDKTAVDIEKDFLCGVSLNIRGGQPHI